MYRKIQINFESFKPIGNEYFVCIAICTLTRVIIECNTVALHTRNLLLMVTEVYKSLNRISPEIMLNIFTVKHSKYSLRSGENLEIPSYLRYNSTFGVNTFDFRAVMTWSSLPTIVKSQKSTKLFKHALKRVSPNCSCKICA